MPSAPAAVFRDIARAVIVTAAGARRRDGEALIRRLDATPIPLKAVASLGPRHSPHPSAEIASALRSASAPPGVVRADLGRDRRCRGRPRHLAGSRRHLRLRQRLSRLPLVVGDHRRQGPSLSPGASATRIAATLSSSPSGARASLPIAASRSAIASRAAAPGSTRLIRSNCARSSLPAPMMTNALSAHRRSRAVGGRHHPTL